MWLLRAESGHDIDLCGNTSPESGHPDILRFLPNWIPDENSFYSSCMSGKMQVNRWQQQVEMQIFSCLQTCWRKNCKCCLHLHGFLFTNGHVIIALVRVMNFLLLIFVTDSIKSIDLSKKRENNIFVSYSSNIKGREWFHCSLTNLKMHSMFLTHLFQCQRFTVNIHKKYNRRLQY